MADKKERLLARKREIEKRLAELAKAEQRQREKQDKRRAELAGQAVLKHARQDAAFADKLRSILDAQISGARLRALFDLPDRKSGNLQTPPPRQQAG